MNMQNHTYAVRHYQPGSDKLLDITLLFVAEM